MKTAISLPDHTFRRADLVARRLGISRSELYVRALDAYLGPPTEEELTRQFDAVYGLGTPAFDATFTAAQMQATGATW
jgi:metal-responsive CopG/Arc/MetJ family transcriptional regulator